MRYYIKRQLCLMIVIFASSIAYSQEHATIKPVATGPFNINQAFWIEVKIGDPQPVTDLYGISFKLKSKNETLSYVDGSAVAGVFLGASPLSFFQKVDAQTVDMAVTKTSAPGIDGSGIVAKAQFMESVSRIDTLMLTDIAAVDRNGNIIPLSDSILVVTVVGGGIPVLSLSSTTVDVGPVKLGEFKDTAVTISNIGNDTLKITSITSANSVFSVRPTVKNVAPGGSFQDTLRFTPISQGVVTGKILIASNDLTTPDTVTVSVTGIEPQRPTIKPEAIGPFTINQAFWVEVKIGDPHPVTDLYGISFKLKSKNGALSYVDGSAVAGPFLGASLLSFFQKIDAQTVDMVVTKTSAPGVSGSGVVAKTQFMASVSSTDTLILTDISAIDRDGNTIPLSDSILVVAIIQSTGVDDLSSHIPKQYSLGQNYPNPFNPTTTIKYGLPARSTVRLVIYNILGQVIKELINAEQQSGYQSVVWNTNVASGMYFYRLEAFSTNNPTQRFVQVKKMLLMH